MENNKKDSALVRSSAAEYLTFVASTGEDKDSIEMRYEDENIWLTQKMMATLYDVSVAAINQHLKKIFEDGELQEEAVIKKYLITATDGKKYNTNHYNLQAIIAVGFKVNNQRAVRFRVWANQIVEQYTIKGWAMDEERLKNGGTVLTKKYFEEQLERIREIRISERNFYQKLTDIYATSLDYDRNALTTKEFFAKVQNKMHYAVHRHTAAELIYERADAEKPHMGLHTWKDAPNGKIKKSDVSVAKNYLTEDEMKSMELIVSAYLDLAENRARRIAEHVLKRFGQGKLEQRVIILIYGRPDAARDIEDGECICTNQHEACLPEREQACEAVQEVHGYGDKGVDRALAQNRREHDGDAGNAVKQERQQIDKRKTCDGQNGLQREAFFLFHMLLLRLSLSAFHRTGPSA